MGQDGFMYNAGKEHLVAWEWERSHSGRFSLYGAYVGFHAATSAPSRRVTLPILLLLLLPSSLL